MSDLRHPSSGWDVADAIAECAARHPAAQTPHEAQIAEDLRGYDPECRYAANPERYPTHECRRNTGEAIRLGEACYFEARAQLDDAQRVCLACGDPIVGPGSGTAVLPGGRTFRFHMGRCFAQADEAIAEHDRVHPACGSCGAPLTRIDLPSQRWVHETPSACRMPFPADVVNQARAVRS